MNKFDYKKIGISKLLVDVNNPRFEAVEKERDALEKMVSDQPDKLIALSKDILDSGLNPADPIQVTPSLTEKGKFVVLEGNRRVTALKLLRKPRIISSSYKAFFKRLAPLVEQFRLNPINSVQCVVYYEPSDSDRWIELKHTGENRGKGTVSWDSKQQARFHNRKGGNNPIALQAIEFLQNSSYTNKKLKKDLSGLPYTNLERLLTDPDIRDALGVTYKNKTLETVHGEAEVIKGFTKIAEDFLYKDYTVNNVRTKKDRAMYIEEFGPEDLPSLHAKRVAPWKLFSGSENNPEKRIEGELKPQGEKRKKDLPARKTLIPKGLVLQINDPRPKKIYFELKNIKVGDFENAVAVTFRVFIELSIDAFIESKNGKIKGVKKMTPLKEKIEKTINYFEAAKILNDHQLKGIRMMINENHGLLSVDTFNAYVHNRVYSPKEKDLITAWDNIQVFILKLWENV